MLYDTTEPLKEYEESGFSKRFKYNGVSYIYFFIPRTDEQLFLEEYSGEEENVNIPMGVTIIRSAESTEPKNIQNNNGSITDLDDTDIRQQSEETTASLVDDLETGKSERQEESSHKTY